jgi:hypothetical protein
MVSATPMETPDLNHVIVTFIRSSVMSPTMKVDIWDGESFVGELKARAYIQYKTTPGKHLFLGKSAEWSYVDATLQGGRHYVVLLKVYPGSYSARVELEPAIPGEGGVSWPDIDGWLAKLKGQKAAREVAEAEADKKRAGVRRAIEKYDAGRVVSHRLGAGDAW